MTSFRLSSVTSADIVRNSRGQGFPWTSLKIVLENPIKTVGEYARFP